MAGYLLHDQCAGRGEISPQFASAIFVPGFSLDGPKQKGRQGE
jgi:hypothetical protein